MIFGKDPRLELIKLETENNKSHEYIKSLENHMEEQVIRNSMCSTCKNATICKDNFGDLMITCLAHPHNISFYTKEIIHCGLYKQCEKEEK